jgi:hypothetical protein
MNVYTTFCGKAKYGTGKQLSVGGDNNYIWTPLVEFSDNLSFIDIVGCYYW